MWYCVCVQSVCQHGAWLVRETPDSAGLPLAFENWLTQRQALCTKAVQSKGLAGLIGGTSHEYGAASSGRLLAPYLTSCFVEQRSVRVRAVAAGSSIQRL